MRVVSFTGFVSALNLSPAVGAIVVSSAGGRAVVDAQGNYQLQLQVPLATDSIQLNAIDGNGDGLRGSLDVMFSPLSGRVGVPSIRLARPNACDQTWLSTFGRRPGVRGFVFASQVFDDGSGEALYVGGTFLQASNLSASRIAKWNGKEWSALGNGLGGTNTNASINAIAVFDDGGGPALYAGGKFTTPGRAALSGIAKWDGRVWSPLGTGVNGRVSALTVFDDGGGEALFVGGSFSSIGGLSVNNIAKWDGSDWSALGLGANSSVNALEVFDDGGGEALYAGGFFTTAGGAGANRIAKWDGSSWVALGSGLDGGVHALEVYDVGIGKRLYIGGQFKMAGGSMVKNITSWNGSQWGGLASRMYTGTVTALAVHDDGGGAALFVGGDFVQAGQTNARGAAKWDLSGWATVGAVPFLSVTSLTVFEEQGEAKLFAGATNGSTGIRSWNGSEWGTLGSGLDFTVQAVVEFDDGGGPALFAGGSFNFASGTRRSGIAKWNGAGWDALDQGAGPNLYSLAVFDDGDGEALYAGGDFTRVGSPSIVVNSIAKWDGTSWEALGTGLEGLSPSANAMAVFDDGSGSALYVGGRFTGAGGQNSSNIVKWDGINWTPLNGLSSSYGSVQSLEVFDDGGGAALYVGGSFRLSGETSATYLAKWNGSSWSVLGAGLDNSVAGLEVFDDGGGEALYAGGIFKLAGGLAAAGIAKWDGLNWTPLASGVNNRVFSLAVLDDGSGPALFVAGGFTLAGGLAANNIAKWDGGQWSALGSGLNTYGFCITSFDDGGGEAIFVGGAFDNALDSGDSFIGKWGCMDRVAPVLSVPDSVRVLDKRRDGPGEIVTFSVSAVDAVDPAPSVLCTPPSGSLFPRGDTLVTCVATDELGNQSSSQFIVTVESRYQIPN